MTVYVAFGYWICLVLRRCNHLRIASSGNRNEVQNCLSRNKPEWVPTAPQGSKHRISCLHFISLFPERSIWGGHHYVGGEQAADRWCIVLLHSPTHWRKRLPAGSFMVSKEVIRWRSTNLPAMFPCLKIQGGIIVSYWHGSSTVTLQNSYNFRISLCIFIFFTSCLPQQKEDLTVKSSRKPTAHWSLVSKVLNAIFAKDLALFLVQAIRSQVLLPLLTSKGCAETSLKSSKTQWPTSVLYDCKEIQKLKLPFQLGWAF